jgi:signal transduction histidine kinase
MTPDGRSIDVAAATMRAWSTRRSLLDRLRLDGTSIFSSQHAIQSDLITILNEVADAVSSAMSVDDVLLVIVDRAKRITDTDKAVLVLSDEHQEHLDLDTIVVRGRRDQHLQQWWQSRLEVLGDRLFRSGEVVVEEHPAEGAWLLCCPILVQNRPIGLLCGINRSEHPFTQLQQDFYSILAAFASSAIENARLAEESRYVLLASERDRIARAMHDGVVQSLFSISLGMEVCKKQLHRDPEAAAERLDELQQHLNSSMAELRRFIYDLRPAKLTELGLVAATEYWIREVTMGRSISGRLKVEGESPRLTPSQESCLYQVAKEAVSNVVRHSGASEFEVRIDYGPERVRLEVHDDGDGFEVSGFEPSPSEQIGLRSIGHRVEREGGHLSIDRALEQGTTVVVELPVRGSR